MKKFLLAALLLTCATTQQTSTTAPNDMVQIVMGATMGATLGLGTAKDIAENKVGPRERWLKRGAIVSTMYFLYRLDGWRPLKYAVVLTGLGISVLGGVAQEQESRKKRN